MYSVNMDKYVILQGYSLFQALHQMNIYKVKFLLVVDGYKRLVGTLTDGDIRRGLLNGMKLNYSVIDAACRDFVAISANDGLAEVLVALENPKIEFLPVWDESGKLVNLITRRALNVLLLQNINFSMDYDFSQLDENALEHEIFARPWGFYKTTILNDMFQSKVIHILPKQALSLQSHNRREEYWIIVNGKGLIQLGDSVHETLPGGSYFIPKGCKHRLTNMSDNETLIFVEVQIGDYFGEDDIYRYDDVYGRT